MGLFDIFRKKKTDEVDDDQVVANEKVTETKETVKPATTEPEADLEAAVTMDQPVITTTTAENAQANEDEPNVSIIADNTKDVTGVTQSQEVAESEVTESEATADEVVASDEELYAQGLAKSRKSFGERMNAFFAKFRSVDEDFFEDLEDTLIQADVGYQTAMQISDELRDEVKLQNAKSKDAVKQVIIDKLIEIYEISGNGEDNSMHFATNGPTVILFVGVNGVGKTTTIGKMAHLYKSEGKKVLLAAADTFRAGATQQLQEWGRRDGVDVVSGPDRIDPASVVFDAVKKARNENYDVLFVDTAGRLQNNVNLMQELAKMKRIIARELPEAPHEVLIVLDGTTGQNALQQAKLFKESTDVTGIVLTKLDGTAKGGIVLAIRNEMHLPVKWVGLGEQATDLRVFIPDQFVQGLFKGLID